MSEPNESVEEPTRRFTEIRQFAAGDRYVGFTTCIECGTGIFIDPEDRKNDIHPIAAHIEWHDNLVVWFEQVDELKELIKKQNKAEFTKEVMDDDRRIQQTTPDASNNQRTGGVQTPVPPAGDVPDRREVGTDRPEGPRPGPVPGVPREGREKGPGNAGQPRQQG